MEMIEVSSGWINVLKKCETHTEGYYSHIKKRKILPFKKAWMSLEDITLSKITR